MNTLVYIVLVEKKIPIIILPPLPRKDWAAIGCTEIRQISQPIGSDCTPALL